MQTLPNYLSDTRCPLTLLALSQQLTQPSHGKKRYWGVKNQTPLVGEALMNCICSYFSAKSTFVPVKESLARTQRKYFSLFHTFEGQH